MVVMYTRTYCMPNTNIITWNILSIRTNTIVRTAHTNINTIHYISYVATYSLHSFYSFSLYSIFHIPILLHTSCRHIYSTFFSHFYYMMIEYGDTVASSLLKLLRFSEIVHASYECAGNTSHSSCEHTLPSLPSIFHTEFFLFPVFVFLLPIDDT